MIRIKTIQDRSQYARQRGLFICLNFLWQMSSLSTSGLCLCTYRIWIVRWSSYQPCLPPRWVPSKGHIRDLPQGGLFWATLDTLYRVTPLHMEYLYSSIQEGYLYSCIQEGNELFPSPPVQLFTATSLRVTVWGLHACTWLNSSSFIPTYRMRALEVQILSC